MRRRMTRDWTMEEYDAFTKEQARCDKTRAAADEGGGPRLTLVPERDQEQAWPTDLLPPQADEAAELPLDGEAPADAGVPGDPAVPATVDADGAGPASLPATIPATPFDGVDLPPSRNRLAGWSADRQRVFLAALAETGSVHLASEHARLTARSAYRMRTRSPAFARAWDAALQLAVGRLSAIAFDRAIHGRVEQLYQDGELVGERRVPNDRLLTWLLARLDPRRFALPWEQRGDGDPQAEAVAAFPGLLDALTDAPA